MMIKQTFIPSSQSHVSNIIYLVLALLELNHYTKENLVVIMLCIVNFLKLVLSNSQEFTVDNFQNF